MGRKFMFILLFVLVGSHAWAMSCSDIRHPGEGLTDQVYLSKPTFQISKASCVNRHRVSEKEMETWLDQYGEDVLPWAEVNGVRFVEESSARLGLYSMLTLQKSTRGEGVKVKGQEVILMAPDIPFYFKPNCKKVLCAIKEVFGAQVGLRLAYMLARFNMNGSHLRYPNASPFTVAELDEVLMALQDIPTEFLPITQDMQLTRLTRGKTVELGGHPCTLADNQIRLYDLWEIAASDVKRETLIHEVAHALSDHQFHNIELKPEWLGLSQWIHREGTSLNTSRGANRQEFVSDYAMSSPREDFAESFTAYIYEPQLLLRQNPAKFQFLKDVIFKGRDFLSINSCRR
ncbi:putative zinc-binding metallopeptidase [Bdellovibrio sp. HCB2-146]|uniref:putative zinc-binding metallopeptidase n=1 Tax=Bdellovibrio sp. HCB2-146 TaxID=3394362 RepID=UPI0039BD4469